MSSGGGEARPEIRNLRIEVPKADPERKEGETADDKVIKKVKLIEEVVKIERQKEQKSKE